MTACQYPFRILATSTSNSQRSNDPRRPARTCWVNVACSSRAMAFHPVRSNGFPWIVGSLDRWELSSLHSMNR